MNSREITNFYFLFFLRAQCFAEMVYGVAKIMLQFDIANQIKKENTQPVQQYSVELKYRNENEYDVTYSNEDVTIAADQKQNQTAYISINSYGGQSQVHVYEEVLDDQSNEKNVQDQSKLQNNYSVDNISYIVVP